MWSVVNRVSNAVFDAWLWPMQSLAPTWQIVITALPVTVFALLVFRFASNQDGITAAKNKIKAFLLELWLYKDDIGILFRAQGKVLRYSLTYMRYALVPMAIMIVPLALVIVQLESLYAFRGLNPGESTIFAVTIAEDRKVGDVDAILAVPDGVTQQTPALRVKDSGQIMWRIRGESAGRHRIVVRLDEMEIGKIAVVGSSADSLAPLVYREGDWRMLGYPAEAPLRADAGAQSLELAYPANRGRFIGLSSASWLLMGVTLLFGFVLRGFFGVTF